MCRNVWVSIFWLIPRTSALRRVKRTRAVLGQELQDQHGPLVGHAADQVVDQGLDARIDRGGRSGAASVRT